MSRSFLPLILSTSADFLGRQQVAASDKGYIRQGVGAQSMNRFISSCAFCRLIGWRHRPYKKRVPRAGLNPFAKQQADGSDPPVSRIASTRSIIHVQTSRRRHHCSKPNGTKSPIYRGADPVCGAANRSGIRQRWNFVILESVARLSRRLPVPHHLAKSTGATEI